MRLILVRHGETDGNAKRQYIGRTDLPLNETGRTQAEQLASELANENITHLYHSPLKRTRETANIFLRRQKGAISRLADARLTELDFGRWEGLTYVEASARDHDYLWSWYDDPWTVAPPNGETLQDLDQRLTAWHDDLLMTHIHQQQPQEHAILAVAHGGVWRWWLTKYVFQDPAQFPVLHLPPGGYAVCSYENGNWKLAKGDVQRT